MKTKKLFHKHSAFCLLPSAFLPAFTLIELLIVMVVIAILVGVTIPVSRYAALRARLASQKIYIEKIKSALEDYRAAYGEYPITPETNLFGIIHPDDVLRHYPASYATECYYTTNSPFTNVFLAVSTVESITTGVSTVDRVDYGLTYPLMLRQRAEGARPFMDFNEVTIAYLVYRSSELTDATYYTRKHKKKGSGFFSVQVWGMRGNPVNRPKAIDPVSMRQWKYTSLDGVTYTLTTNSF